MAGRNGGRPPLSDAEHARRGTTRRDRGHGLPSASGHSATPIDQQAAPTTSREAPDWLSPEGRDEWSRVTPMLDRARVLSDLDLSQLANYCEAAGLAAKATKQLRRQGLTVKRGTGATAPNPLITIAKEARAQALSFAQQFGLTPASRTRVHGDLDPADEPNSDGGAAERFLFGGKPPAPTAKN